MLVDHRTYTLRAGTLRKQLALYEKHGFAIQKRYFGEPLGWLVSDTGDVNSYVHIWLFEDAADRNRKREAKSKGNPCLGQPRHHRRLHRGFLAIDSAEASYDPKARTQNPEQRSRSGNRCQPAHAPPHFAPHHPRPPHRSQNRRLNR